MKRLVLATTIALVLSACQESEQVTTEAGQGAGASVTAPTQDSGQNESQRLQSLVNAFFQESLSRSPVYATFVGVHSFDDKFDDPISDKSLKEDLAFHQGYLARIGEIDANSLQGQDRLTYDIFKRDRELAIAGHRFPGHLQPYNQMWGVHNFYPMLGSGGSAQPFQTEQDYLNFISRTKGFVEYMDSTITAMQEGMEKGVVLPKSIVLKVIPQLQAHIVDTAEKSVFYGPVRMLQDNDSLTAEQKARLEQDYEKMIMEQIVPCYQRLLDFVQSRYLTAARDSVGLSALPDGTAWYEHMIATHTTLPLSAEEIHQYGLQEVARIRKEMEAVKEKVGFQGDLPAFFEHLRTDDAYFFQSEEAVIDAYQAVKEKINARLDTLFEIRPKADYEVRAVEPFRAASSAGASYQAPAPDGSRPGIFYINTYDLKAQPKYLLETLSIHEAAPGHHFQIAIQQEVEGLPQYRKFNGYTVFAEGWALYAESLGKDLGLFTDPMMWYGRLSDEQLRAMRLVVDTGIHAKGWTREQAMTFMAENSSMAASDIEAEVERYIAIPGQALAYKVGERAIRQMREKLKAMQGERFDIRQFHTQVLIDGAMPMPVLESKLVRWAKQQG
ncbi:DUF885 domain-containing protein [Aliiglaciecola sp. CAU 1673]|uniref:DUF885 domain-containing protein n=1 Tax=Aliiglaciecola sp. CAU 1673 TaxID=3032595 RepID=UPI0023DCC18F|nr:DUF885 domain-containing protein [Aliiglaciecola sp. CAU 1673]MDF2178748.1 DUF885 domain-containing protein [Aliiglaciecola sp. CAU 1673]